MRAHVTGNRFKYMTARRISAQRATSGYFGRRNPWS